MHTQATTCIMTDLNYYYWMLLRVYACDPCVLQLHCITRVVIKKKSLSDILYKYAILKYSYAKQVPLASDAINRLQSFFYRAIFVDCY